MNNSCLLLSTATGKLLDIRNEMLDLLPKSLDSFVFGTPTEHLTDLFARYRALTQVDFSNNALLDNLDTSEFSVLRLYVKYSHIKPYKTTTTDTNDIRTILSVDDGLIEDNRISLQYKLSRVGDGYVADVTLHNFEEQSDSQVKQMASIASALYEQLPANTTINFTLQSKSLAEILLYTYLVTGGFVVSDFNTLLTEIPEGAVDFIDNNFVGYTHEGKIANLPTFVKPGIIYREMNSFEDVENLLSDMRTDTANVRLNSKTHVYTENGVTPKNSSSVTQDESKANDKLESPILIYNTEQELRGTFLDSVIRVMLSIMPGDARVTANTKFNSTYENYVDYLVNNNLLSRDQASIITLLLFDAIFAKENSLTSSFDNAFGSGSWRLVTLEGDNLPYLRARYINDNGEVATKFGSMDMLLYTDKGDIYVVDFKTSGRSREELALDDKYIHQVNSYKNMIANRFGVPSSKIHPMLIRFKVPSQANIIIKYNGNDYLLKINEVNNNYTISWQENSGESVWPDISFGDMYANMLTNKNTAERDAYIKLISELFIPDFDITAGKALIQLKDNVDNKFLYELYQQSTPMEALKVTQGRLNTQALLNTSLYQQPVEATQRSEMIVAAGKLFAYMIISAKHRKAFLDYLCGKEVSKEFFNTFTQSSMRECVSMIGFNKLANIIKDRFFNPNNLSNDNPARDAIAAAYDNFNYILMSANSYLAQTIGMRVRLDNFNLFRNDTAEEEHGINPEELANTENEVSEIGEKDQNYSFQTQNESPMLKLNAKLRSLFAIIPVRDVNGKVLSSFVPGCPQFYDDTAIVEFINKNCSHARTGEELSNILKGLSATVPLARDVLKALGDDYELWGNMWNVFGTRNFNPMFVINSSTNPDGTLSHSMISINEITNGNYLTNLNKSISNGRLPLFSVSLESRKFQGKDIVRPYVVVGTHVNVQNDLLDNIKKLNDAYAELSSNPTTEKIKEYASSFLNIINTFGPKLTLDAIVSQITYELTSLSSISNSKRSSQQIVEILTQIAQKLNENRPDLFYDPEANVGSVANLYTYYKNLSKLVESMVTNYVTRESMSREGGKAFYSYVSSSYIDRVLSRINVDDKLDETPISANQYLDEQFQSYFINPLSTTNKFLFSWGNELYDNKLAQSMLRKGYLPLVDKTEYLQLGDAQTTLAYLTSYFKNSLSDPSLVRYAMPLYSVKPVFETLQFIAYIYNDKNVKNWTFNIEQIAKLRNASDANYVYKYKIADNLILTSLFELNRMKVLVNRAFAENVSPETFEQTKTAYDINKQKLSKERSDALSKHVNESTVTIQDLQEIHNANNNGVSFRFLSFLNNIIFRKVNDVENSSFGRYLVQNIDTLTQLLSALDVDVADFNLNSFIQNLQNQVVNFINLKDASDGLKYNDLQKMLFVLNYMGMSRMAEQEKERYRSIGLFERVDWNDSNPKEQKDFRYTYLDYITESRLEKGKKLSKKEDYDRFVDDLIDEFSWNNYLARINIIHLTTRDLVQYSSVADFFKRFAEVHAPSANGNPDAMGTFMVNGKLEPRKASEDGKLRYGIIADETLRSEYETHLVSFAEKFLGDLLDAGEFGKDPLEAQNTKDAIFNTIKEVAKQYVHGTKYTDSQGLMCPTSYKKQLTLVGRWNPGFDEVYQRIVNNKYDNTPEGARQRQKDSSTVWKVFKPFAFSNRYMPTGLSGQYATMPVSMQNKNSQYMMTLFDALSRNLGSGKWAAIINFMEMSHHTGQKRVFVEQQDGNTVEIKSNGSYNGKGIDVLQFASASKVSPTGACDLSKCTGYDDTMEALTKHFYTTTEDGQNPNNYNPNTVQDIDVSDFGEQTAMNEHVLGDTKLEPSQTRAIGPGNIHLRKDLEIQVGKTKMNAEDALRLYYQVIGDNIRESADKMAEEFGGVRDGNGYVFNPQTLAYNLSLVLLKSEQRLADNNIDIISALQLDKDGNFMLPPGEFFHSLKNQQMITSISRSRVTKQYKSGGALVQVSAYSYNQALSMAWVTSSGKQLMSFYEFVTSQKKEFTGFNNEDWSAYTKYIKDNIRNNGAKFSHFEVFATCPDPELKKLFKITRGDRKGSMLSVNEAREFIKDMTDVSERVKANNSNFTTEDSNIISKWEKYFSKQKLLRWIDNPKLKLDDFEESLKMIVSRVPGEDNYSMFPCKIKDWLPDAPGGAIMLPKEVTLITGSDNDGDKMHFLRKPLVYNEKENSAYMTPSGLNSRAERDNLLLDLMYGFMTEESAVFRMMNPGSFENEKKWKYILALLNTPEYHNKSLNDMKAMSFDELFDAYNDIETDDDVCTVSTQVKYHSIYGGSQINIGGAANHNTSHALLVHQNIGVKFTPKYQDLSGEFHDVKFTLFGIEMNRLKLDPLLNRDKMYTNRIIANFLDAFVDTTKESVGYELNVNSATLNTFMLLARLGFREDEIVLFMNQPVIVSLVRTFFNKQGLSDYYQTFSNAITEAIGLILDKYNVQQQDSMKAEAYSNISAQHNVITVDNLFDRYTGRMDSTKIEIFDLSVLYALRILNEKSRALQTLTKITQFNSIRNSAGPESVDTMLLRKEIDTFLTDETFMDTANFVYLEAPDYATSEEKASAQADEAPLTQTSNTHIPWTGASKVLNDNKMLKEFYETTVGQHSVVETISKQLFVENQELIGKMIEEFVDRFNFVPTKDVISHLIKDFVFYNAIQQGVIMITDSDREYLTKTFPGLTASGVFFKYKTDISQSEYKQVENAIRILNENPFVARLVAKFKGKNNAVDEINVYFNDETSPVMRNQIIAHLEELATNSNPYVRKWFVDFIKYELMRNGFNFSPMTATTAFSPRVKLLLDQLFSTVTSTGVEHGYLDLFKPEFYKADEIAPNYFDTFFDQFVRNRWYLHNKLAPRVARHSTLYNPRIADDGKTLVITSNPMLVKRGFSLGFFVRKNVNIDDPVNDRVVVESFVPFVRDNHDNLYQITSAQLSFDQQQRQVVELRYQPVDKLSVKHHYIQYGNVDLLNVFKGMDLIVEPEVLPNTDDTTPTPSSNGLTNFMAMFSQPSNAVQPTADEEKAALNAVQNQEVC